MRDAVFGGREFVVMQKALIYKNIYLWIERAFLLFLAFYLFLRMQFMTTFYTVVPYSPFPPNTEVFLLCSLLLFSAGKALFFILSDSENDSGRILLLSLSLPAALAWFLVFQENASPDELMPAYYAILIFGCVGTDYRTLLKVQVCVVGAFVLSAAFCCFAGAIDNLVYWTSGRHSMIRSSWGIDYVTDMAAYWFFLCLAAWMAWDRIPGLLFLIPGLLCFWISYEIAQSNTGVIFSILFLLSVLWVFLLEQKGTGKILQKMQKILDCCSCASYPFFGMLMVFFVWAFHEGYPFAQCLDQWNHGRLLLASVAYDNYGIHWLGRSFPLIGAGGSTFSLLGYNYVDCSYLQMLLRYGVLIFLVYLILWPIMARTAAKNRKYRLVLGLLLIAFHAVSEQRFLWIDYNLLLVAPFSVFSLGLLSSRDQISLPAAADGKKRSFAALFTAVLFLLPAAFLWRPFLSWVRTLWTVMEITDPKLQNLQRAVLLFACLLACAILVCLIRSVYRILLSACQHRRASARDVVPFLLILVLGSAAWIRGNRRIDRAEKEYAEVIAADADVIQAAEEVDGLNCYVTDLPALYDRRYDGLAISLYNGDDLARLKNIAVITDGSWNSRILFNAGFSYAEVSSAHAVYTDSAEFVDRLTELGYTPTQFSSKRMEIPLDSLAKWNGLSFGDHGGLLITENHPLFNVWNIDLPQGSYSFSFDFILRDIKEPDGSPLEEETVFLFRFTDYSGTRTLLEQSIPYSQFDESGRLLFEINNNFNAPGVEFSIIPLNGAELELLSACYQGVG